MNAIAVSNVWHYISKHGNSWICSCGLWICQNLIKKGEKMMISKLRKSDKTYEPAYWGALRKFNLKPSEFLVLFLIRGLTKKTGKCYASKKFLAERLNISQPTVFSGINKLIRIGLIEKCGKSQYGTESLQITTRFEVYLESLKGLDVYNDSDLDSNLDSDITI